MDNLLNTLIEPVIIFGKEVPLFIIIVSAVLILGTLYQMAVLWRQARGHVRSIRAVVSRIDSLLKDNRKERKHNEGVTQNDVDALRGIFDDSRSESLQDSWIDYESQLVLKGENGLYWSA